MQPAAEMLEALHPVAALTDVDINHHPPRALPSRDADKRVAPVPRKDLLRFESGRLEAALHLRTFVFRIAREHRLAPANSVVQRPPEGFCKAVRCRRHRPPPMSEMSSSK